MQVFLAGSTDFYKRQLEDEVESLNNRIQELEKENYDLRNENKNLKRLLASQGNSKPKQSVPINDSIERDSQMHKLLNQSKLSADKKAHQSSSFNNPEFESKE